MTTEKPRLRHHFETMRSSLDREARQVTDASIRLHLAELPELASASTILAYWPMPSRGEIDLIPLLDAWRTEGRTIGLPVVTGGARRLLDFLAYEGRDALRPGPFGLLQPVGGSPLRLPPETVAVVPALACDRSGTRLGYGGGYYDRFLATRRIFCVAPVLFSSLVDSLPREPHDIPVSAVVTEQGVHRTSNDRNLDGASS